MRKKTKLYMFCHNTAFDLPVLDAFKALPNREYKLIRAVIDAPLPRTLPPTPYSRFGGYAMFLFVVVFSVLIGRKRLQS